jgi:hypothetical protein
MEVYKYKYNIHFCIQFQFLSYTSYNSPAPLEEIDDLYRTQDAYVKDLSIHTHGWTTNH